MAADMTIYQGQVFVLGLHESSPNLNSTTAVGGGGGGGGGGKN
jgi:hypothetical protein